MVERNNCWVTSADFHRAGQSEAKARQPSALHISRKGMRRPANASREPHINNVDVALARRDASNPSPSTQDSSACIIHKNMPIQEYWLPGYGLSRQIVLSQ